MILTYLIALSLLPSPVALSFEAPLTNDTIPYYDEQGTIHIARGWWNTTHTFSEVNFIMRHEYCHYMLDKQCHLKYEPYWQEMFCNYYADPPSNSSAYEVDGHDMLKVDKTNFMSCFMNSCSYGYIAFKNCYNN